MVAFNAIDTNHDGMITRQEWNAAMGLPVPVDSKVSSTTTLGYGASYAASPAVPTNRMPPVTYTAAPSTTCMPSTTYSVTVPAAGSVEMAPYSPAYTTPPSAAPKYAIPTATTYQVTSVAAPPAIRGGNFSVKQVYAAPSPVTYTRSTTLAPATFATDTTEIAGGSVSISPAVYGGSISVAPAVYTAASALPMVTRAAKPVATTWKGGSLSLSPGGGSVNMVTGGSSVEIGPAVQYLGSSVSYSAAPVAAPIATRVTAPPVTTATIPPVTTVTAPPVTTATVMEPLPTKVYIHRA